jgi:hypothetical protein
LPARTLASWLQISIGRFGYPNSGLLFLAPSRTSQKLTIWALNESDSVLFSRQKLTAYGGLWTIELCLWMDSACRCADSANHITSSRQALIPMHRITRRVQPPQREIEAGAGVLRAYRSYPNFR